MLLQRCINLTVCPLFWWQSLMRRSVKPHRVDQAIVINTESGVSQYHEN